MAPTSRAIAAARLYTLRTGSTKPHCMRRISSFRSHAVRAWDLAEKLRRLAAVRHAVVPNDTNVPASDIFGGLETGRCPRVRSPCVVPQPEDDELARMIDAFERLDV